MRKIIAAVFGIAVLAVVLASINLSDFFLVISRANIALLALSAIVIFSIVLLRSLKWNTVLKAHSARISLAESVCFYLAGFFLGIVTPARVGDFSKAFYLKEKGIQFSLAVSSVFFDRIIDLGLLLFTGSLAVLVFYFAFGTQLVSFEIIALLFVLFVAVVFAVARKSFLKKISKPFFSILVPENLLKKFSKGFDSFHAHFCKAAHSTGFILIAIVIGVIAIFLEICFAFLVSSSLNLSVSFVFFFIAVPAIAIVELIPVSISGIGTREAVLVLLFSLVSVSAEQAVAFSVLYFSLGYIPPALAGWLLFMKHPLSLEK